MLIVHYSEHEACLCREPGSECIVEILNEHLRISLVQSSSCAG